jgi:hypothetical protein
MSVLTMAIGMIAGNFIYEAFTARRWDRALGLSFFQAMTLGIAWFATH